MGRRNIGVFCGVLLVAAIVLVSLSVTQIVQMQRVPQLPRAAHAFIPPLIATVAGIFACCCALLFLFTALLRRNSLFMASFFCLALVTILAANALLFAAVYWREVDGIIEQHLMKSISDYPLSCYNETCDQSIDRIQHKFSCCGSKSFSNWNDSTFFKSFSTYPPSCYTDKAYNSTLHQSGCFPRLSHWFATFFCEIVASCAVITLILFGEILFLLNTITRRLGNEYKPLVSSRTLT